jgi:hypothetical protein
MTTIPDTPEGICRLAKMMIEEHGGQAAEYAMDNALKMRSRGDLNGESVWLKVFDSIWALKKLSSEQRSFH